VGRFLYKFVIFTQLSYMMGFRVIITNLVVAVFILCCFVGGNFCATGMAMAKETDGIVVRFVYGDRSWEYNSQNFESDNFYFRSIGAKFNRWGSSIERAELLGKVRKMGFSATETLRYVFVGIDKILDDITETIERPSIDASYKFEPNNLNSPFSFYASQVGYKVDFDAVLRDVIANLREGNKIRVVIKPIILEPNVDLQDIQHFANLRGSFYTTFNSDVSNRSNNIAVATKCFNGLVMQIGEEFSFNKITGRRSEEKGYMSAKIIVDKKYVEGFGGGVCQVSTTLYNALLMSGVEVNEVHSHSLVSSYINMGFDAMVNFGSADLRWVNNTDSTLFLQSFVQGNRVYFKVYGVKMPHQFVYKRITEIEKTIEPQSDEIIVDKKGEYSNLVEYCDESAYLTIPKLGYRVRAILETYEGQKLVNRRLLRRVNYPAVRGVKVYGTKEKPKIDSQVSAPLDKAVVDFWQNFA